MLGHVGEQDLVNDDGPHDEAHDRAEGEDVANGRGRVPVVGFTLYEIGLGHDQDVAGQMSAKPVPYRIGVCAWLQPEQAQLDFFSWPVRKQPQPVVDAGHHGTIDAEGSAE